jgi:hypothetical protein
MKSKPGGGSFGSIAAINKQFRGSGGFVLFWMRLEAAL